ncbi:hypothetical protein EMCRGX_G008373, partial [Ephydatia muelleri]
FGQRLYLFLISARLNLARLFNEMWLRIKAAFSGIVLFAWVVESVSSQFLEQCMGMLPKSGCFCSASSYSLNISTLLPYPVILRDNDREFLYGFSPCERIDCNGVKAALCQYDTAGHRNVTCGVDPMWKVRSLNPLDFTVKYTYGYSFRLVNVNFREAETNFTSTVVEDPKNTYTFLVSFYVARTISGASAPYVGFYKCQVNRLSPFHAAVLCVCLAVAFVGTMATRRVRRTRRRATAVPQRRIDIELRPLPSVYLEIIPSPTELLGGPIPPSVEHIYESPYF